MILIIKVMSNLPITDKPFNNNSARIPWSLHASRQLNSSSRNSTSAVPLLQMAHRSYHPKGQEASKIILLPPLQTILAVNQLSQADKRPMTTQIVSEKTFSRTKTSNLSSTRKGMPWMETQRSLPGCSTRYRNLQTCATEVSRTFKVTSKIIGLIVCLLMWIIRVKTRLPCIHMLACNRTRLSLVF